jgi:uracil-DNA glycosylase family 4
MKKVKLTRELLDDTFTAHAYEQNLSVDVLSSGPLNASIAFVGEGPGEAEVRHRPKPKPFVGGSGKLLWGHVQKFGYTQDNIYCTNVVKRQISLSRKGNLRNPITADEFNKWSELLRWELTQLPNVKIIVALGNYALEALTENTGITKWRGSVLDTVLPNGRLGQVIVTFNPAYVVEGREPRFEPFFLMDLMRIAQVEKGVFKPHNINKIINPTYREAIAYISDMQRDIRPIALDTEAINEEVACIGLSNNPHEAICIAFRSATKNMYTKSQEVDILLAIQKLADTKNMIAQNAQFDSYFMWLGLKLEIDFWFDILLGHHTLYPQLPHSLAFMTTQYTNHPFYKDDADGWYEGGNIDAFWEYNCCDCAITYAVFEKQQAELKKRKLDKFFFNHVMRAQPHLVRATVHGVGVDVPIKEKILEQVREDVDEQREKVYGIITDLTEDTNYRPNLNSAPQMQDLYFNRLKLIGRGTSTDDNNRKEMMKNPRTSPIAKQLLIEIDKYKEDHKFMSVYAEGRISNDSRFRCEYKQFGVSKAPGRLSSSSLLVTKEGGNMQNQPMRARGMYVADPGMVFLYFDLAQAEAQVVSFRADIPKWKEQFALAKLGNGYDCHRALASEMFKIPYDQIPKDDWTEDATPKPTKRYVAKRCRHGLNYRMERFRLSQVTQLPYNEASQAFVLYHKITPELELWWHEEEKQFRLTRTITNAFGRELRVIQRIDETVLESIIAFYAQSTIGDKIVQVWYQSEEDDEWPVDARVCIDVHDNLVALASPKTAKTALKIMKKYAESPIIIQDVYNKRKPEPLSIPCELKMSYPSLWDDEKKKFVPDKKGLHRWSEMEKVKL